jgi:hypothetical protein
MKIKLKRYFYPFTPLKFTQSILYKIPWVIQGVVLKKSARGHPKTRKLSNFTIRQRFCLNETILKN